MGSTPPSIHPYGGGAHPLSGKRGSVWLICSTVLAACVVLFCLCQIKNVCLSWEGTITPNQRKICEEKKTKRKKFFTQHPPHSLVQASFCTVSIPLGAYAYGVLRQGRGEAKKNRNSRKHSNNTDETPNFREREKLIFVGNMFQCMSQLHNALKVEQNVAWEEMHFPPQCAIKMS